MLMNETSLDAHLCIVLLEKGNGKTAYSGSYIIALYQNREEIKGNSMQMKLFLFVF